MKKQVKGEQITSIEQLLEHLRSGGRAMICTVNTGGLGGVFVFGAGSYVGKTVADYTIKAGEMFKCHDADA